VRLVSTTQAWFGSGTIEIKDIEYNTGISDSEFEFVPPEGVKVFENDLSKPPKVEIGLKIWETLSKQKPTLNAKKVSIKGREGWIDSSLRRLTFKNNGVWFVIQGSHLTEDELIKIAESMI